MLQLLQQVKREKVLLMKKILWATLATALLFGGTSLTTYAAEEQTMPSDQAETLTNKEDSTATEDSTSESTDTLSSSEEVTQDSQTETKEQAGDKATKEDTPLTTKEVDKTKKEVIDEVAKQVNDGKKEKVDEDVLSNAESIRKALLKDDYGITEKQLKSYSDEQLMDAATLFKRYNQDLSGMDLSAFVRLLNALYQDKTLNVDKCLAQLSFNPESFGSFSALTDSIEDLQTYLKTLYPSNSSFFSIKELSNEELTDLLKNIQMYEEQAKADGHSLDGGKIAWISYAINHPDFVTDTDKDKTDSKDKDKTKDSATKTSDSSDKKEETKKGGLFPQTGEKRGLTFGLLGVVIILAVVGFYFWNRSKKTKE